MLIKRGAIILEMGRDINTLLNGRFANHLFHLHESHILFFIHPIYVQWCPCCIAHSVVLQEIHLSIHFNFHFQKICIYPCWMNFGWFFTTKKSQLHWSLLHGIQSHDCHHTRVGWRYYRNPTFGCKSCGFPGVPVDVNRKSTESCRVIAYFLATLHGEICSCNRRLSH